MRVGRAGRVVKGVKTNATVCTSVSVCGTPGSDGLLGLVDVLLHVFQLVPGPPQRLLCGVQASQQSSALTVQGSVLDTVT